MLLKISTLATNQLVRSHIPQPLLLLSTKLMTPSTVEDTADRLRKLKLGKSPGHDRLTPCLLKAA